MADYTKDPYHLRCYKDLKAFFEENSNTVFFTRQIELLFEQEYFHWVTNNVIHDLVSNGTIITKTVPLNFGGSIKLYWHKKLRYYTRGVKRVTELVNTYSDPKITISLGDHCELLVAEAFGRNGFQIVGTEANEYKGVKWNETNHDLDYIMERDGVAYGIEIKNTLSYMSAKEFNLKMSMCEKFRIRPLFINRFFPRTWAMTLVKSGGYAFFMKYQLYPRALQDLVYTLKSELNLPVDCPRRIEQGTMDRLLKWHTKMRE